LEFIVYRLNLLVHGSGFTVYDAGCRVQGKESRVEGLWVEVKCLRYIV